VDRGLEREWKTVEVGECSEGCTCGTLTSTVATGTGEGGPQDSIRENTVSAIRRGSVGVQGVEDSIEEGWQGTRVCTKRIEFVSVLLLHRILCILVSTLSQAILIASMAVGYARDVQ
jgi:hypothetical protein